MTINGLGSFINGINAGPTGEKPPIPAVGDGATFFYWSDRSAATVTRIETSKSGKTVTVYVVGDIVKWRPYPDGYAESYSPGTGPEIPVTLRKYKGGYRWASGPGKGTAVRFGGRDAYRDPSF